MENGRLVKNLDPTRYNKSHREKLKKIKANKNWLHEICYEIERLQGLQDSFNMNKNIQEITANCRKR